LTTYPHAVVAVDLSSYGLSNQTKSEWFMGEGTGSEQCSLYTSYCSCSSNMPAKIPAGWLPWQLRVPYFPCTSWFAGRFVAKHQMISIHGAAICLLQPPFDQISTWLTCEDEDLASFEDHAARLIL
jgi:hypothetical protein